MKPLFNSYLEKKIIIILGNFSKDQLSALKKIKYFTLKKNHEGDVPK